MKTFRHLALLIALFSTLTAQGQGVEKVKESKSSYTSIIDMLRGEPGLTIKGTGDDGTMPQMYIRGIGTNSEYSQPLFVVDGIRMSNILYLQPEQVHSITVIKDGTASIYGMEGANGVIEIKTKAAVEESKAQAREKKELRKKMRKEKRELKRKKKEKPQ